MTASAVAAGSIVVGVLVLGLKLAAWRVTGSVALYSDALESTVNIVAAIAAFAALRIARRPPDEDHPWGHAKAEYFSAVAEGALIVVAAVAIVRAAAGRLLDPTPLDDLGLGAALSVGASLVNGGYGLWMLGVGKRLGSPALRADGAHLLTDVGTSAGVLVGIGLARLTGFWILDPLLACIVALQIIRVGWRLMRESLDGLMDGAMPAAEVAELSRVVRQAADGARVGALRARRAGTHAFVEVRLLVPATLSVGDAHETCDRIEAAVLASFPRTETFIHVEPES